MLNHLPVVLDGATGTRLQLHGMPAGACTAAWVLEHPDFFLAVKRADVAAGSDTIFAPTFGAIAPTLRQHHIDMTVREMNLQLVALAREAADGRPVGGDIAPSGLQLFPVGTATFEDLVAYYTEQAAALDEAGVEYFVIETQMSLAECRAAIIAVRSVSDKPLLASFSCGNTGRSLFGEDLNAILVCLQDMGVSAFGLNCVGNLSLAARLLAKMKPYARVPLLIKPNAGEPILRDGRTVYNMTPAKLAAYVPRFVSAGARFIGGCCGTDERFIAAIRSGLDAMTIPEFTPAEPPALAASAYRLQELTPRIKIEDVELDDDIVENAAICEAMGTKLLRIEIRDELDVDTLDEAQYSIRLPLAVRCSDEELLKRFLKIYNGKPVIL